MAANCFSCSMSVLLLKAQSFRLQNRFDSPAFCKRVVISLLIKGPKFTRCSKSSEVASKIEKRFNEELEKDRNGKFLIRMLFLCKL